MKKIFSSLIFAALMLLPASCNKSEPVQEDCTLNFRLEAGEAAVKAISDGAKANQLYYVVFKTDAAGTKTSVEGTLSSISFPYNLTLKLAKGFSYKVFFFAQNTALQAYTITTANGYSAILEADYSKIATGDEAADAFYAYKDITVNGNLNETVTLKRAVAQVNVGANDYDAFTATAPSTLSKVIVSYTDIPSKVQLLNGNVLATTGTSVAVNFPTANSPMTDPSTLIVGSNTYKYLSMNYVLAPKSTSALFDATYIFKAADNTLITSASVPNVPIQMNHRTNILGQILTGNAIFNIVIDQTFDTPDYQAGF